MNQGIYVHIPYCKQACHYCDFHFSTNLRNMDSMVDAICSEIDLRADELSNVKTLYFGGGTPSVLSEKYFIKIVDKLSRYFDLSKLDEFTIEVNPDDIDRRKLKHWKLMGINRLSIGIQSFNQDHLTWMNRSHTAKQARQALEEIAGFGFKSSNVDLIYGFNNLSIEEWVDTLMEFEKTGFSHLSAYCLTIEPKTAFAKMSRSKKLLDDELAWTHFKSLHDWADSNNWDHYEISNLSKPSNKSQHNSSYWNGNSYIGIGPGSHSFNGDNQRVWNVSDNWKYIDVINSGSLPQQTEVLSKTDLRNEKIMLGLRTKEGVKTSIIKKQLSDPSHEIQGFLDAGEARIDNNKLVLSLQGWWKSDSIASCLFEV